MIIISFNVEMVSEFIYKTFIGKTPLYLCFLPNISNNQHLNSIYFIILKACVCFSRFLFQFAATNDWIELKKRLKLCSLLPFFIFSNSIRSLVSFQLNCLKCKQLWCIFCLFILQDCSFHIFILLFLYEHLYLLLLGFTESTGLNKTLHQAHCQGFVLNENRLSINQPG